jgi:hypothetical protein
MHRPAIPSILTDAESMQPKRGAAIFVATAAG